ncbi:unnamed protein product [Mycena citricolor]|uniref:Tc1-like transposase DDE domain-containing protein n=1 Tax=Mycena citricolor TaxID=2018698 RepID=A0AAD2HVR3_9AGAR|nr:unnamed protein product [Mycena citricolor]CAK5275050.1 unnamed protein product [Mycena citricolor]CAK5275051.1 unnamed protein product [Mycena citricolor]CAK5275055.1 unnamed protein product [Mycena citricolor]CAK5275059.1 unnamed protein product [Mycena citricolor]
MVQEVVEDAGHLCLLLPKFHCELNFIEYFWGAVKKYLRNNCDYTFNTLKTNMPLRLPQSASQQSGSGNRGWSVGWTHIGRGWRLNRLSWKFANSAHVHTNHTDASLKALRALLTSSI